MEPSNEANSKIMTDRRESIDRESPMPFYSQLKAQLVDRITNSWRPGARIPGEFTLCQEFGVSRTVVRHALDELVNEGRMVRRKGQGTFVADRKIDEHLVQSLTGLYEDVAARGGSLVNNVRKQEFVPAPIEIASELEVDPGTAVLYIERLRFVDDEPWVLTSTYLPHDLAPGLISEDLEVASLYQLLEEKYHVDLDHGRRVVEAVSADPCVSEALQISGESPVLLLRSTSWNSLGQPVESFMAYHRGDHSRFQVYLRRRKTASELPVLVRDDGR